jgi:hypothetical protein
MEIDKVMEFLNEATEQLDFADSWLAHSGLTDSAYEHYHFKIVIITEKINTVLENLENEKIKLAQSTDSP